jgi:hypothetical protein
VGEKVRAVRGDFDLEERVGGDELVERAADGGVCGEDHEALMVVAEAEFAAAAHHAAAEDAAEFAFFDGEVAGEDCAGEGDGDAVARGEVFRAADDLAGFRGTVVDLAEAEFIGVGVRNEASDSADDDEVRVDAAGVDAFDFDACEREEIGEGVWRVAGEVEVGREPGERNFHESKKRGASMAMAWRGGNGKAGGSGGLDRGRRGSEAAGWVEMNRKANDEYSCEVSACGRVPAGAGGWGGVVEAGTG